MNDSPITATPNAYLHAAALRRAFPDYTVNVLSRSVGGKLRIEVLNRSGGNPYCLISDDPREIWRELRHHA